MSDLSRAFRIHHSISNGSQQPGAIAIDLSYISVRNSRSLMRETGSARRSLMRSLWLVCERAGLIQLNLQAKIRRLNHKEIRVECG